MKPQNKAIITLISIPVLTLIFFSSNIYGYFRFKSYCSSEGGLRVYEQLEKNVGWLAKDRYDAQTAALLAGVGFVRYKDKEGRVSDIKYVGGDPQSESSFEKLPESDESKLQYKWRFISEEVSTELRLERSGYELSNYRTNKVAARFYRFSYSKFDRNHTPLDMNIFTSCFSENGGTSDDYPQWLKELNTAFKN